MGKNKLTSIILVASLSFTSIAFASNATIDSNNKKIQELQEEKNALNTEKSKIDSELTDVLFQIEEKQGEIDVIQDEIDSLQNDIDEFQEQINETMDNINEIKENIKSIEVEYDKKEKEQKYQEEVLSNRLKRNYINNTYNEMLGIILDSNTFSEMLFKIKYIRDIMNSDKDTITLLKEIKADLDATKEELNSKKTDLDTQKKSLEYQQELVKDKQSLVLEQKEVLDAEFASLQALEDEKQARIASLSKSASNLDNAIQDLTIENARLTEAMQNASSSSSSVTVGTSTFIKPTSGRYTSMFGPRIHPITGKQSNHTGVDIANSSGTPIVASDAGKVVRASYYGAYGNCIVIEHGNGYSSMYAHLSSYAVSVGDVVSQGQRIGSMGSTGWSTGPHLHFEIWKNGVPQNPVNYIGG